MKSIHLSFVLSLVVFSLSAKADPKLAKILAKVETQILQAKTLSTEFVIETTPAEMKKKSQKGSFRSKANKYILILPDHEVYYDGKDQYSYLKDRKEVQISSTKDGDFPFLPQKMAGLYKGGQYEYILESQTAEHWIFDFKPVDKKAEFFKVKLKILKKNHQMKEVQIFEKNGDRHLLTFQNMLFNTAIEDQLFSLNTNKLQGVRVEDLR